MIPAPDLEELFHAARLKPQVERSAFLRRACGDNPDTVALLESLLVSAEASEDFLETPAAELMTTSARELDRSAWIGTTIGNYHILRIIAAGGMGIVYEAEQAAPKRKVALKLLRRGLQSAAAVKRFRRESELLGRLRHDGIAQVYEAGVHHEGADPTPFFAMEFFSGAVPVTDYARNQSLAAAERIAILCKVCDAVQYCHDQGVIHRDLKPGNILVTPGGEPKVIDFGVAQVQTTGPATQSWHTIGNPLIGSWPYMSPEQVSGDAGEVDAQTDVYALGVIAYEILAGRLPLDLADLPPLEAARIIRDEEPLPLGAVDRQLRGDLETITATAMAKEKSRRYPSAAALAADLRRFLRDEPIQARRAGAVYQFRKFVRRNRALTMGLAIAFTGLLIGGVGAAWQASSAIRERNAARASAAQADWERARAEENFRKARDVVDTTLTRVANDLWNTPHMTELQRDLYEEALKFYEGFLEQKSDDPTIRGETARACIRVAQIHDHLGNREKRLEFAGRAVAISKRLSSEHPDEIEYRTLLADSYGMCAIQKPYREWGEWLEPGLKELEIRQELAQRNPNVAEYRRTLASRHVDVGNGYEKMGKLPEAETHLREALTHWERFRRDFPGLPVVDDNGEEAHAHHWLADLLLQTDRFEEAETHLRRAVQIRTPLVEEKPDHLGRRRELGYAKIYLGRALLFGGKIEEAEQQIRSGVEIYEPLVQLFPAVPELRENLRFSYNHLSWALRSLRRFPEAEEAARKAIALPPLDPGTSYYDMVTLGWSYFDLGEAIRGQGRMEEAADSFREALSTFEGVLAEHPDQSHASDGLATTVSKLALVLHAQGDFAETETLLRAQLARSSELLGDEHPHTADALYDLAMLLYGKGDVAEAEALLREELATSRKLLGDGHPQTLDHLRNLSKVRYGEGDFAEAEALLREGLAIAREELGDEHEVVGRLLGMLGETLLKARKYDEAEPVLRECLALRQQAFPDGHPRIWLRYCAVQMLGGALAGQAAGLAETDAQGAAELFAEAESMLLDGYLGMKDDPRVPDPSRNFEFDNIGESLERIVQLYEAWDAAEPGMGYDAEAAEWRATLQAWQNSTQSKESTPTPP